MIQRCRYIILNHYPPLHLLFAIVDWGLARVDGMGFFLFVGGDVGFMVGGRGGMHGRVG